MNNTQFIEYTSCKLQIELSNLHMTIQSVLRVPVVTSNHCHCRVNVAVVQQFSSVFSGITSCEDYWKIHILTMADEILNTKRPHVVILEQPVSDTRFRYPIEGRGAGVLKGEHSSAEKTTFPKIKIVGYKGPAVVVVSCVTHDTKLPRCHPHNLVSPATVNNKDSCRKGVFHTSVNTESMTVEFSHLGVQCVREGHVLS